MSSFNITCKETSMKVNCNKEIEIITEIGIVDTPSEVTVCFSLDSKSCFFINESNPEDQLKKTDCKEPFSMLPTENYIDKKHKIRIGCFPKNNQYYTILKISAQTDHGQNAQSEIRLIIDCYSNFISRFLKQFRN